jgi:acid phosphatase type 7
MRYFLFIILIIPISIYALSFDMKPYLQTPTSTSMYVCWFASSSDDSVVQYGTSASLGLATTGNVHIYDTEIRWHYVKLQNLLPNTRYFYKCVTGLQESAISSFTTAPVVGTEDGHLRIIFMGDTRTNTTDVTHLVTAIQAKLLELYGTEWRQKVNLLCHVGDIVEWSGDPEDFIDEYFTPFSPLSSSIPFMIAVGNHEAESDNFYNFMETEDFAGTEGKKYYSFDLANSRFIFLNSNTKGNTQLGWLNTKLSETVSEQDIDYVFGIMHHYGHSELNYYSNSSWVQNYVIPAFGLLSKPTMVAYGHAHCYERGTAPEKRTRLLLCGGGGAPLDYWGTDVDQQDYPEIHITTDYWVYTILDIDLNSHSYEAKTYTLGNAHVPLDNIEIDGWNQQVELRKYDASAISAKAPLAGQIKLVSASQTPISDYDIMSTQIQVSASSSFAPSIIDNMRNWVDFYEDTGAPNYNLINVNAGIDLRRYSIPTGLIQQGQTYYWRVRYRSQNADWGNWSDPLQFDSTPVPFQADFEYQHTNYVNTSIQFIDTSVGDPTSWAWDFNGDGTIDSRMQDPIRMYITPGIYPVTLSVQINGINYTVTKQIAINPGPLPTPSNVHINIISNSVYMTWDSVLGASSYRILIFDDPYSLQYISSINVTEPEITLHTSDYKFFRVVAIQ